MFDPAAPTAPFDAADRNSPDPRVADWIASLAGVDPQNPNRFAPPPMDDEQGKPISKRSRRSSQALAISRTRWRCTRPAKRAGARSRGRRNLCRGRVDAVGPITGISSSSQEFKSPRRGTGWGLFCIGRRPPFTEPVISPMSARRPWDASRRAAVRAFIRPHARTCRHAAWQSSTSARGPGRRRSVKGIEPGGIGFAHEIIARKRSCRILVDPQQEIRMTVYLISLALAGLVAIAVWEGLS